MEPPVEQPSDQPSNGPRKLGDIPWSKLTDLEKRMLAGTVKSKAQREAELKDPPLSSGKMPDPDAMEHVWDGKPIETHQQKRFQELLEEEGRAKFWDRMRALRKAADAPVAGAAEAVDVAAPFGEIDAEWKKFQEWCRSRA